jgi:hypothetical protein
VSADAAGATVHRLHPQAPTVRLLGVQPGAIGEAWPFAAPLLAKALARDDDRIALDDLRASCESGDCQLFLIGQVRPALILAALVTEWQQYPHRLVLRVIYCGGVDLDRWLHLIRDLERWGAERGADVIEVMGRAGWGRVLGYPEQRRVFAKELPRIVMGGAA